MASGATLSPGTVVALDIGGTKIDIALADRSGTVLERVRLATRAELGPDQALGRAAEAVSRLARRSLTVHASPVIGYAAVSPGIILADRILLTPNLPGWENLSLAARLAQEFGVERVAVDNDVRAAAIAELRFGNLRDVDPGVYVGLGTGIAAALTVGGEVVSGANQAAGEIGYVSFDTASVGAGRAPLEDLVGGKAIGDRASALLGTATSAAGLFARTDPAALQITHQALGALAITLANIAVFVDPQRVVIGGGLMASAHTILPVVEAHLRQAVPFPPELVVAHFTQDASLYGAVAMALDAATDPPAHAPVPQYVDSPTATVH